MQKKQKLTKKHYLICLLHVFLLIKIVRPEENHKCCMGTSSQSISGVTSAGSAIFGSHIAKFLNSNIGLEIFNGKNGYSRDGYRRQFNSGRSGGSVSRSDQRYGRGNREVFGGICAGEMTGSVIVVERRATSDCSVRTGKMTREAD